MPILETEEVAAFVAEYTLALGQLGWSLRQIQKALGARRETAGEYLKSVGVTVRPSRGWGKKPPAKAANGVTTDLV